MLTEKCRKDLVQGCQQLRHGLRSLVPHIADAEGFAFYFSVSAIDEEVVFFAQGSHEGGDIDSPVVGDRCKGPGPEAFWREVLKFI